MLYDGAMLLFSHDEVRSGLCTMQITERDMKVASGTDLAKLYVDTLNQAEAEPEELHFLRISKYV